VNLHSLSDQFRTNKAHQTLAEVAYQAQQDRGLDLSMADRTRLALPDRELILPSHPDIGVPNIHTDLDAFHGTHGPDDTNPSVYDERSDRLHSSSQASRAFPSETGATHTIRAWIPNALDDKSVTDPRLAASRFLFTPDPYSTSADEGLALFHGPGAEERAQQSPVRATTRPSEFYDHVLRHLTGAQVSSAAQKYNQSSMERSQDLASGFFGNDIAVGTAITNFDDNEKFPSYPNNAMVSPTVVAALSVDPQTGRAGYIEDMAE
jgi:hypothetical protein